MKTDVTVIIEDGFISVEGRGLFFEFTIAEPAFEGITALQWHNNAGDFEGVIDGERYNQLFGVDKYTAYVAPYVALWEAQRIIEDAPPPPPSLEDRQETVRMLRDGLLVACDHTQLSDTPLSLEKKEAWKVYRQALRDIPLDTLFATTPEAIVFPVAP